MKDRPDGKLHPIEGKYIVGAAVVGFLLTLLLTDGSLATALGALGLIAGIGWVAHHLIH